MSVPTLSSAAPSLLATRTPTPLLLLAERVRIRARFRVRVRIRVRVDRVFRVVRVVRVVRMVSRSEGSWVLCAGAVVENSSSEGDGCVASLRMEKGR